MNTHFDDILTTAVPGFQPIIDVARNRIVGYEALARRQHPATGELDSIGHLFYGGQIPSRDLLILDRDIRQQAIARLPELPSGFLSLNISPDWINQLTAWASTPLLTMLYNAGVDPANVVLEITEQQGSIEALKQVVKRYREEGYRVAIDDFGAGSSHMHRIMELEPDILKLDMQLFKNAANGGQHHDLVHSVSRLAEKTGCQLVCEGVETEQEFHFGLSLGAAWMQGFLFSPARADFQEADAFRDSISHLRHRFLQQRVASEQAYNRFTEQVMTVLRDLKQQCMTVNDLAQVTLPANTPVLKFYLCDGTGTQISPNYEPGEKHLETNAEPQGVNWCWRPHFYQLLAAKQTLETEFTASNQYRDVSSRQLCRSYVTRVSTDQYLLVDVLQPGTGSREQNTANNRQAR